MVVGDIGRSVFCIGVYLLFMVPVTLPFPAPIIINIVIAIILNKLEQIWAAQK